MNEFDPFGFMGAVAICYFVVAHIVRGIKRGDMKQDEREEDDWDYVEPRRVRIRRRRR